MQAVSSKCVLHLYEAFSAAYIVQSMGSVLNSIGRSVLQPPPPALSGRICVCFFSMALVPRYIYGSLRMILSSIWWLGMRNEKCWQFNLVNFP